MQNKAWWPEIFTTKDVSNRTDAHLCADGLVAWALCETGNKPPEYFGEVMVEIGKRLGIAPTGDNLLLIAKKFLPKSEEVETQK